MGEFPWTDPEPRPGDFDAELATIDSRFIDAQPGRVDARLRIVVSIEGEDAERLERLSADRGVKPGAVIADLLRDADRPAA